MGVARKTNAPTGDNDEGKNTKKPKYAFKALIYYNDPYQTESDQSIDGGDSDLDVDGNIIKGGTRKLTPEEFEEYWANMGESKGTENENDGAKESEMDAEATVDNKNNDKEHDENEEKSGGDEVGGIGCPKTLHDITNESYWIGDTRATTHLTNCK